MNWIVALIALAAGGILGWAANFFLVRRFELGKLEKEYQKASAEAKRVLESARADAESIKRSAELEAKEETLRAKENWERELAKRRSEIERGERRLDDRESMLDRKYATLESKQEGLSKRIEELEAREKTVEEKRVRYEQLVAKEQAKLERVAGLSAEKARREVIRRAEEEARAESVQIVRRVKEEAARSAEREARNIVAMAIEKVAADHAAEVTVSVVPLPNDEMKGRIIGREGRNIRAFENQTGVDVIVDDTPEAVILSAFDPVRREIARIAMEKLVADGRIHPGRIEEVIEKAAKEVEQSMQEAAEDACYQLGIHGLHHQLMETLGRMKYRTSYGQNQLQHSIEVARLTGNMAAELGLNVALAKRMGLLHDIGKGMTHEHEGTHVELGYELCKRCNEPDQVLNAIRAHHGEEPARYPETFLLTAADAISGARPGARRESFEAYVKRLEKLEEIATSFDGVQKCFAIQAGREVRIMVTPEAISDEEMAVLSENTARRIEQELQYPGQIKVVVVRETRAVDFAR
ncbi:MAG: ribonuclease Y [Gemmatimonadetes bacterium]|uniref:Ribonuclease Y n=1 Tax=Candidatus Kutchimonas denitrificans TaxID=3056748 RepID=A0AAE5CCG9_9BACT|nr:ribonuclease Y [Gemmatimonadota bacterium]NIR74174.1 ribonuclease Y [Candidatus Kutchimonas denitrificans]NIR99796.1 ribonuclease Y [Gemmatimonadota bacterium]NIT65385.1 ribonuclease Y [Gemmatimonadota bacterium]NIU51751.1 ribonuclease Y [Gemmatimonadota bacterium]